MMPDTEESGTTEDLRLAC